MRNQRRLVSSSGRYALLAWTLVAIGGLDVLGSAARGQTSGGTTGGSGQGKKAKPEIELPPEMLKEADVQGSTPEGMVQRAKKDLARYPSSAAKEAITRLVVAGPSVVPPLRALVEGIEFGPRVGAAIALADLKDVESAPRITTLLAEPRAVDQAQVLYEAAYRLSVDDAEKAALANANSRNANLRRHSLNALSRHLRAESIPGVRALLSSDQEKTRLEAFTMLEKLDAPGLEVEAMRLLGDSSSALARKVTDWIATHKNDALIAELVGLALEEQPTRKDLWALLTLAEIEERYNTPILREDRIPQFTTRLRSLDPLVRVSAAIALSHVAARSADPKSEDLLQSQVVPAIVETFLRGEYFKDAIPLLDMSATRLKRLTGIDLGTDLTKWREAWLGGGATPRIRRDLSPDAIVDDVANLVVTYTRKGVEATGPDQMLVIVPDTELAKAPPKDATSAGERSIFVDAATMLQLATAIRDAGVLRGRSAVPERVSSGGFRVLSARIENRERTSAIGAVSDPDFEKVEALLSQIADRNHWQTFWLGARAEFAAFYTTESKFYGADSRPEDRVERFTRNLVIVLPQLSVANRCEALGVLLRDPAYVSALTPSHIKMLVGGLDGEPVVEGAWLMLLKLTAAKNDLELSTIVATACAGKYGVEAAPYLGDLLASPAAVRAALRSETSALRLAALAAARRHPDLASVEDLKPLLSDVDARVRREAVLAAARNTDPASRALVADLVKDKASPLHRIAVEALGVSSAPDAASTLVAILGDNDAAALPEVAAALRGLARRGDTSAIGELSRVAANPVAAPERRTAALESLADVPGAEATAALRELLANVEEMKRPEIAYLLAQRFDTSAVPPLLAVLEKDPTVERARDSLEMVFCCEGGEKFAQFSQRGNGQSDRSGDDWFAVALDAASLDRGGVPSNAALVKALADERWYVRYGATVRLAARFHAEIVPPGRFATKEQLEIAKERLEGLAAARAAGA